MEVFDDSTWAKFSMLLMSYLVRVFFSMTTVSKSPLRFLTLEDFKAYLWVATLKISLRSAMKRSWVIVTLPKSTLE